MVSHDQCQAWEEEIQRLKNKINELETQNKKHQKRINELEFMIENGLGWEDMKSDGAKGEGADR